MRSVSSAEFNSDPARYQQMAAREPVAVVDQGETKVYLMPAGEFERYQRFKDYDRKVWSIEEIPEEIIKAIEEASRGPFSDEFDHELED